MSRRVRFAVVCALALAFPVAAAAHVIALPAYLADGRATELQLTAPDERLPHLMTKLTVTMPEGITLSHATPPPGWQLAASGRTAVWSGGRLGRGAGTLFPIVARTDRKPGLIYFDAAQHYDDGGVVRWRVSLTVLPAPAASPKQHILPAVVTGVLGMVVIGLLLYRMRERQRGSLREG